MNTTKCDHSGAVGLDPRTNDGATARCVRCGCHYYQDLHQWGQSSRGTMYADLAPPIPTPSPQLLHETLTHLLKRVEQIAEHLDIDGKRADADAKRAEPWQVFKTIDWRSPAPPTVAQLRAMQLMIDKPGRILLRMPGEMEFDVRSEPPKGLPNFVHVSEVSRSIVPLLPKNCAGVWERFMFEFR